MRTSKFLDNKLIRIDFLEDRFTRMKEIATEFEDNAQNHYPHTEFVVIDETLCKFFTSYKCDFKVYMKDKPGNYGLLFCVLAEVRDRYVSGVIPYVTPLIHNPEKGQIYMVQKAF